MKSKAVNATYRELDNPDKKEGKKKKWPVVLATLVILLVLAAVGYYHLVKACCRGVTQIMFEYGRHLNVEDTVDQLPQSYQYFAKKMLDEDMKEQLDGRKLIKEKVHEKLEEEGVTEYISAEVVDKPIDIIINDIIQDADYEITGVKGGFTSCAVTVRASNVDYDTLFNNMSEKIKEDITNPDSSLWGMAQDIVQSFLQGIFGGGDDNLGEKIGERLIDYYQDQKKASEKMEYTGTITYKYGDEGWTLDHVDEELISAYYGISFKDLGININDLITDKK